MRINALETLHADGGWRTLDFVKVTTDGGVGGWSEYNESFGGSGLTELIRRLGSALIGKECLFGRREYRPFLERDAMDVGRSSTSPGTGSPNP